MSSVFEPDTTVPPPRSSRRLGLSGTAAAAGKVLQLATAAFIGFSLPLCLAVSDVGIFFFAQSVVVLGALIAQLGFAHTIPATVGRSLAENDSGRARSIARTSFVLCLFAGTILGGILGLSAYFAPDTMRSTMSEIRLYAPILIPMIVMMALLGLMAELQRAVFSLIAASFLPLIQNLGLSVFIAAALLVSMRPSVEQLLTVSLAILSLALLWGTIATWRTISRWTVPAKMPLRTAELLKATWPNLVSAVAFAAASQLDIWVVSLNGKSADVAHYGIALRIASLLAIPLTVVSLTILPHIVANWTIGRRRYLQWLLTVSATGSLCVAGLGLLAFGLGGRSAIHLFFGDAYSPAFLPALILSVGQVLFTAAGVAGYILIVLGKQKLAMASMLLIGVATVLCAIPAMQNFGIVGVACVYSASAAIQGLTNAILVRKYFSLRSYALPINPLRAWKILSYRSRSGAGS